MDSVLPDSITQWGILGVSASSKTGNGLDLDLMLALPVTDTDVFLCIRIAFMSVMNVQLMTEIPF